MAENSVWHEVVKTRWAGYSIIGDGPAACVVRCSGKREVHLFATTEEAMRFRVQLCNALPCEKKHNPGSLVPFVPALAKPRGENLRAYMESGD